MHHITLHPIISYYITSHHILSYYITSYHIIASHNIYYIMCIGFLTPASLHYVRNHGPPPRGSWKDHRISLGGLSPSPIVISMSDLWTLPRHSVAALLGNVSLSLSFSSLSIYMFLSMNNHVSSYTILY